MIHAAPHYAPTRPALPENYARVCVHGVRRNGTRREIADDSAANIWCVFGALTGSTAVECFGEFTSKSEAWSYALELSLLFDWPIWNCAKGEA